MCKLAKIVSHFDCYMRPNRKWIVYWVSLVVVVVVGLGIICLWEPNLPHCKMESKYDFW